MLRRLHAATATSQGSGKELMPGVVLSGSTMVQVVLGADWSGSDIDLFATARAAPAGNRGGEAGRRQPCADLAVAACFCACS